MLFIERFYQQGDSNKIYRTFFCVSISIGFCVLLQWVLMQLCTGDTAYLVFLEKSLPVRFAFALVIIAFVTVVSWFRDQLEEQQNQSKRQADIENLLRETELTKLRQQLQPHFLFNSLNSISALVVSKPQEARKMVHQLSDFLRGTLRKDEEQVVLLSEELDHLKLYLEIEKVRFGHRLSIAIDASEESLSAKLPSLVLQPIVENAIKFGLYDIADEVCISIRAGVDPHYLSISISNPFDPQTQSSNKGMGFGLSSIARRMYLLYGRNDLLVTAKEGTTFITTLKIPLSL